MMSNSRSIISFSLWFRMGLSLQRHWEGRLYRNFEYVWIWQSKSVKVVSHQSALHFCRWPISAISLLDVSITYPRLTYSMHKWSSRLLLPSCPFCPWSESKMPWHRLRRAYGVSTASLLALLSLRLYSTGEPLANETRKRKHRCSSIPSRMNIYLIKHLTWIKWNKTTNICKWNCGILKKYLNSNTTLCSIVQTT